MRKISRTMELRLKVMRLFCAVLLVISSLPLPTRADGEMTRLLCNVFSKGLCEVGLLLFFAVFGYTLASRINEEEVHVPGKGRRKNWYPWWRDEMRRSVRELIVPFYVWTAATFGVRCLLGWRPGMSDVVGSLFGLDLTSPGVCGPYWVLRAMFFLAVLSPLVNLLTRRLRFTWALASVVVTFAWKMCSGTLTESVNGFFSYGFPLVGLVGFSVGLYLRREHLHYSSSAFGVLALIAGAVCWCALYLPDFPRISHLPQLAKLLLLPSLAYGIWALVPARALPELVQRALSPLFFLSGPVLAALSSLCDLSAGAAWHHGVVFVAVLILAALGASVLRRSREALFNRLFVEVP